MVNLLVENKLRNEFSAVGGFYFAAGAETAGAGDEAASNVAG